MGHADGGHIEDRSQMEGQAGPAGMVAPGGIHQEDIGGLGQRSYRRLQQRSLPQRQ